MENDTYLILPKNICIYKEWKINIQSVDLFIYLFIKVVKKLLIQLVIWIPFTYQLYIASLFYLSNNLANCAKTYFKIFMRAL